MLKSLFVKKLGENFMNLVEESVKHFTVAAVIYVHPFRPQYFDEVRG